MRRSNHWNLNPLWHTIWSNVTGFIVRHSILNLTKLPWLILIKIKRKRGSSGSKCIYLWAYILLCTLYYAQINFNKAIEIVLLHITILNLIIDILAYGAAGHWVLKSKLVKVPSLPALALYELVYPAVTMFVQDTAKSRMKRLWAARPAGVPSYSQIAK